MAHGAGTTSLKLTWMATRAAAALSPRLAGVPAARLWFTPWRVALSDRARARERSWLAPTTPLTIPFGGGRLGGFSAGSGPVVLLVHGWGERASALGAFVAPVVDAGYRVVGVDLPAHASSPGSQTDALEIAAALRAVSEDAGGVAAVVSHSMGAHATTLALSEGLGASAALLLSPAVRLEHGLEKFGAMFKLQPNAIEGLRATIERRYGAGVWRDLAGDRLAESIGCPALIVHDEDDPQVDLDDARMLARAWPDARLTITTGLGHNKVVRDAAVIEAAVSFIAETVPARDCGAVAPGRAPG